MIDDLALTKLAALRARHAAERHSALSENIANADTPGFQARDIEPFAAALERAAGAAPTFRIETSAAPGAASPNGNTVSIEDQMARASSALRDHETALLIYAKALGMLRTAAGARR